MGSAEKPQEQTQNPKGIIRRVKERGEAEGAGEDPVHRGSLHATDRTVTVRCATTIMNENGATAASVEIETRLPGTC